MNKSKLYIYIIVALLVSNILLICFNVFKKSGRHARPKPREIIIEKLNFDTKQIADYDVIIKQHQQAIRHKEEEILLFKNKLYAELDKNENSSLKDSLVNELGKLQMDIENIHYNHFNDIKKICKSEQMINYKLLLNEIAVLFSKPMMEKPKKP